MTKKEALDRVATMLALGSIEQDRLATEDGVNPYYTDKAVKENRDIAAALEITDRYTVRYVFMAS